MALKGNHGTLHADVSTFLDDPKAEATTTNTTVDGDHGRIETRTAVVSAHVDWLQERRRWPGLQAIAKVTRIRETAEKTSSETAYYLLSQPLSAERFNAVARDHWGSIGALTSSWMKIAPETVRTMDLRISRSCATWLSMSCARIPGRRPYVRNSTWRPGTRNISPTFCSSFEMRSPWDAGGRWLFLRPRGSLSGPGSNRPFSGARVLLIAKKLCAAAVTRLQRGPTANADRVFWIFAPNFVVSALLPEVIFGRD
jgi:hypothetical protein